MKYNFDNQNRELILCILQITTLYNAMQYGWNVKKIGNRRYELSKKLSEINDFNDFNLDVFVNSITNYV